MYNGLMIVAEKTRDEELRINYLKALNLLNRESDEFIDNINFLASKIMDTTVSLVTLIDDDKQWIKSAFGADFEDTERSISFCSHTILDEEPMVIENALEDERFADNPLVNGQLNSIRFYAGAQLKLGTVNLGALCLIDTKPRKFTDSDKKALKLLAGFISDYLEAKVDGVSFKEQLLLQNKAMIENNIKIAEKMCDRINNKLAVVSGVLQMIQKRELLKNGDVNDKLVSKSLKKVNGIALDIQEITRDLTILEEVE